MAAAANMPNIKSGKVLQISELDTWSPDEIHGNAVRILGRIQNVNVHTDLISIEYHGQQLEVDGRLLGSYEKMTRGSLFQFLGELERTRSKFTLTARLCRDMTGLDSDEYDRCLRVRNDFENKILRGKDN